MVEFVIPEEGSYIMVDHHFANASQGAIGLTDADAQAMLKQFNNLPMPNQNLSDEEIEQYLAYFRWADAQPAGAAATAPMAH